MLNRTMESKLDFKYGLEASIGPISHLFVFMSPTQNLKYDLQMNQEMHREQRDIHIHIHIPM